MSTFSRREPQPWESLLFGDGPLVRQASLARRHALNGRELLPPFPPGLQAAVFGMGCFWGAERLFWELEVYLTAVGYSGGESPAPDYREVCRGYSGHAEVVLVVYDPKQHSYARLLQVFWEGHDPTQGMRQGNDVGSQYRSVIYAIDGEQLARAQASHRRCQRALDAAGFGRISTEICLAPRFHYAEADHQQYLVRNPAGYCGLGRTGVALPDAD